MSLLTVMEYTYEDYGPDSFYGCTCPEDDYCRCSVYSGLKVLNVDPVKVIIEIIGHSVSLTPALEKFIKDNQLSSPSTYEVITEHSYYGEEVIGIQFKNASLTRKIQSWVSRHGVEVDLDGIATYLKEKSSLEFKGTVNQAVREALKAENHAQGEPSYVQRTTDAYVKTLTLRDIFLPNQTHFERIEAKQPVSDRQIIVGVVVYQPDSKNYRLIDGYHRYKWARENGWKSGKFIVLS